MRGLGALAMAVWLGMAGAQSQGASEDVARRQLESGRAFARQGNYAEALRDFRAVAETHATTSVADDAWLELARYYLDIEGNLAESQRAVDAILTNYATSDSAPTAYLLAGRLALARGRTPDDLKAALANFDRVFRLFPESDAVPRALRLAGQTLFWEGRLEDALARLGRVTAEYASDASAPEASLTAGRILVAMAEPTLAMEELQLIRNRWPDSPAAGRALAGLTQLHRLYVRAARGAAYGPTDESPGPARLDNVVGMAATDDGRVIWATNEVIGAAWPQGASAPAAVGRPRGLALDAAGDVVVVEENAIRLPNGEALVFAVPQSGGSLNELDRLVAAGQLSGGDWVVMDDGERNLQRFSAAGAFVSPLPPGRFRRLAVSFDDRIAGIERDGDNVLVFDGAGRPVDQIQLRTPAYDLRDPVDLAFDTFGHLYVLDRDALAVFTPYGPQGAGQPVYSLLTLFKPDEQAPGRFDRAEALAVAADGTVFFYDDRAHRILVYR